VEGIEAGISAYLTWEAPLNQLLLVTHALREGEVVVPRHMLRDLLDHLVTKRDAHDAAIKQLSALTRREREVLGLLSGGFDNEGIAGELVISPQTARTHIQNILQKLGVNSRLKAAAFVVQNGLVEELREERMGAA
ncbi:MAG: helix-turn-helix domain-containing protein, partial [Actinomycetota bacterium]